MPRYDTSIQNLGVKAKKNREFPCSRCNKYFKRKDNLERHEKTHDKKKYYKCKLGIYTGNNAIYVGEKPYNCTHCMEIFEDRRKYVDHVKDHMNLKPFKCDYCNKDFKRKQHLNRHIKIHTLENLHQCMKCDKAYPHKSSLNRHMETHFSKVSK